MLGFAFYVQPMLMPLLHELPPGPASVSLTATAVRIVVIGVASLVRFPPGLHRLLHSIRSLSFCSCCLLGQLFVMQNPGVMTYC